MNDGETKLSRLSEFKLDCRRSIENRKFTLMTLAFILPTSLLWLVALPLHIHSVLQSGGTLKSGDYYACGCLLFSLVTSMLLISIQRNSTLTCNKDGISAPPIFVFTMGLNRHRKWAELTTVRFFEKHMISTAPTKMRLDFSSGGCIVLDLSLIKRQELINLLSSIRINAPTAKFLPQLDYLQFDAPLPKALLVENNFTQMWDEEMSEHFASTSFVPLEKGDKLQDGRIEILDQLSVGGSSVIYKAVLKNNKKFVVVKEFVLPKNASEKMKAKALEMFDREAKFLTRLDHPKIAKVFDHFVENQHHYEVIEYNSGMDFRKFVMERGPQVEGFVRKWGEQICEIVTYLHSQTPPIIHRDLTPDNILLQMNADLMLIDFGAANSFVSTATGTMVGKQSYMAAEQVRGKSTPQSDIYSLGCVLYFLLTAKDPEPLAVNRPKTIAPETSQALDSIVAKCTAQELKDRYQTVEEVRQDLVTKLKP